jgi:hypothetical protein
MGEGEWNYINFNQHANASVKLYTIIQEFSGSYLPLAKKHSIVGKHLERVIVYIKKRVGYKMPYLPFTSLSCLSRSGFYLHTLVW